MKKLKLLLAFFATATIGHCQTLTPFNRISIPFGYFIVGDAQSRGSAVLVSSFTSSFQKYSDTLTFDVTARRLKEVIDSVTTVIASTYSPLGHTHTFASLTGKPTTLLGYGIVDGQPLDADLTTIAGLTATNDNFMIGVSGSWGSRTPAQAKTSLSLGNVENTALSTWPGTTNVITVGTISTGTWRGNTVGLQWGGTGSDLSATGGSSMVLRQSTLGGNVSVSQLAALDLSNGTSGSGRVALQTSAALTTPDIGVATATSINKLTITVPATSATLTIANGKTFTSSNTLTLSGTDGSTLNIGTGGALGSAAYTAASAYEVPLTFSTGLTRLVNTVTVNTSQSFTKFSNLTTNGFIKTTGGDGTLAIDANTYVANTVTVNGKALSSNITLGLASSDFANQGTTTTVLHGNAAGNPSFGSIVNADITNGTISLTNKVTDSTGLANGGTGATTALRARTNLGFADSYVSTPFTTTNGTATAITGLSFTVPANEVWSFEFHGGGSTSTTSGSRMKLTYSNTPTTSLVTYQANTNVVTTQTDLVITAIPPTESATIFNAASTNFRFEVAGSVANSGTSCTVTLTVRAVSGGDTSTILAGSYVTARRIQ